MLTAMNNKHRSEQYEKLAGERFVPLAGFINYEISTYGRIRSVERLIEPKSEELGDTSGYLEGRSQPDYLLRGKVIKQSIRQSETVKRSRVNLMHESTIDTGSEPIVNRITLDVRTLMVRNFPEAFPEFINNAKAILAVTQSPPLKLSESPETSDPNPSPNDPALTDKSITLVTSLLRRSVDAPPTILDADAQNAKNFYNPSRFKRVYERVSTYLTSDMTNNSLENLVGATCGYVARRVPSITDPLSLKHEDGRVVDVTSADAFAYHYNLNIDNVLELLKSDDKNKAVDGWKIVQPIIPIPNDDYDEDDWDI